MALRVYRSFYRLYESLPNPLRTVVFRSYQAYIRAIPFGPTPKREFVTQFFNSVEEYEKYRAEYNEEGLDETIEAARERHERLTGHQNFAAINAFTPIRYYALVRKFRPDVVVETGVCNGVSTLVVLAALNRNDTGRLYSVDLPDTDRLPEDKDPGWIIPEDLRNRWELTLGRSQDVLPGVVNNLDQIDMFFHDSLASIMYEEFEIIWPELRPGGLILADDVYSSDDFSTILQKYDVLSGQIAPNVGYVLKSDT